MEKLIDWYKKAPLWLKIILGIPVGILILLGLFAFRPNPVKPSPADAALGSILKDDSGRVADADQREGQLAERVAESSGAVASGQSAIQDGLGKLASDLGEADKHDQGLDDLIARSKASVGGTDSKS